MADRFWVGGTGNINDTGHWSTTSGGSSGASVPTSSDNAIFDANSFSAGSQSVTINASFVCRDFDASATTNNPTFVHSQNMEIHGDFRLKTGQTWTANDWAITFDSAATDNEIDTKDFHLNADLFFLGGGKWTLLTNLYGGYHTMSSLQMDLQNGELNLNGKMLTGDGFKATTASAKTLTFGTSGELRLNIFQDVTNLTIANGATSIVTCLNYEPVATLSLTTLVISKTYGHPATSYPTTAGISASVTCSGTLYFDRAASDIDGVIVTSGKTLTCATFIAQGVVGDLYTLRAGTPGSRFKVSCSTLKFIDYLDVKDCDADGAQSPFFLSHGTDSGNNLDWNFARSTTLTETITLTPLFARLKTLIESITVSDIAASIDNGYVFPGTAADDSSHGTKVWDNVGRLTADDASYADSFSASNVISHYARLTNFGLALPAGASITGIRVKIQRRDASTGTATVEDDTVQIVQGGAPVGTNKAVAGAYPTSLTDALYGGSTDTWGLSLTGADVNSSSFGVVYSVQLHGGGGDTASFDCDFVAIELWYQSTGRTVLVTLIRPITEVLTLTQSFLRTMIHLMTESITLTEFFARGKIMTEVLTITDVFSRLFTKLLSDAVTITQAFVRTAGRVLTETITITPFITRGFLWVMNETITLASQLLVKINGIVTALWSKRGRDTPSWTTQSKDTGGASFTPESADRDDWRKTVRDL